ncbi:MAG: DNA repair protein RecN [Candidatus Auribacter fodinae]|jgi:DNA repair protein RecN (Recombination protein N)|uniref:DNA repair protein RecN n=1 Tax=Candidatus Auribacter fodinae TaxID=2093366 RepID=A0A3A4R6Y2_9BACT|nr:MAG: DNA repair protein RecN [Candidatus Auribacter fodinae]
MLKELHIKNIVLVKSASVYLGKGLNIITGETGAGKSVIIGSLNLVLGERASTSYIRKDEDKCSVVAVFDIADHPDVCDIITESGIDIEDNQLIIRRELAMNGTNRQYINDSPVSLAILKKIGTYLIDMHGQHDHQSLFHTATHRAFLDWFAHQENDVNVFHSLYLEYKSIQDRLQELEKNIQDSERQKSFWEYELKEIESAGLSPDEEDALNNEYSLLANAHEIAEKCFAINNALYEDENSILNGMGDIQRLLTELAKIDTFFTEYLEESHNISTLIEDLSDAVRRRGEASELNPQRQEELEKRIDLIERLKRKFKKTVPELIDYAEYLRSQLANEASQEDELDRLKKNAENIWNDLQQRADVISERRQKVRDSLAENIEKEFSRLGMKEARIRVAIDVLDEIGPYGKDKIEFLIAPNKGESWSPLRDSASGGEISRVMLALKSIFAGADNISAMVFDEIDVNIGGPVARDVGKRLWELADEHQVICITHLPQIASFAHHHYMVQKSVSDERTETTISKLNDDERITEISRMLGGDSLTTVTRLHAKELIEKSKK